jgi:hypothetical protein
MERCQVTSSTFEGITIAPGCRDITVLSAQVVTSRRTGVDVDGVQGLTIWDTRIEENRYYGIRLLNGSKDVFFNKTTVEDNGYDGVHIERAKDVRFERGYYQRNGYNGIFLIDVVNATLMSTRLRNNTYDGLDCDSVVDLVLEMVMTAGNGYNGLRLQAGSHEIQVVYCTSYEDTRSGLNVDSAYNVTVRSFWARQEGGFGVRVEGGSYNVSGSFDLANNTGGALRVQNCHDVRLEDSQLGQGSAGMYLVYGRNAYDIWISNSTTNGTVHLIGIANVSMVNCTFDAVTPDVDTTSRLMFLTLVDVLVLWPTASPVTGALVNATGTGGLVLARGVTNASGLAGDLAVLMETYTGDAVFSENPITFFARKGNEVARNVTNILGRSTVLIVLEDDEDPIPVAPDVDAELNVQARLDGSASSDNGQLVSWVWTFDDGVGTVVLEGRRVNWTFTVLGTFSGQLEVSDSVGHTNLTNFTIRVTDSISPQVVAGSNVTVDQGTILPVDGTSTTDNDSTLIATGTFLWRVIPGAPGPGERAFTGPINSIPFPDMGVYIVELIVTDQSGNRGLDRFWVTVNDTTAPVVDAGVDVEVGEGEEMLLEPAAVTDNDPAFDAGLDAWWHVTGPATDVTLDGLLASFVPPTMGVYQATLHVTDAAGNEGTGSRLVTALDRLPPVVDIGADSTVEVFTEVTFDAEAVTDNDPGFPEGATYRWTITGPRMDEEHRGESIEFTLPWVGEYVITLRVTDASGNEGNDSVRVTSVDTALPAFGPFHPTPLNISDTTDVTITFIITDVGTGVDGGRVEMRTRSPSTAAWSDWGGVTVDGGVTRIEETMVLQFPEGNSLLQLRCWDLAGNGPVVSEEHSILVNSRPVVVVLSPSDGADYGPFDEVLLDASASSDLDGDELSYVWSSDVDGIIGGAASVRAPPLSEGTHRITVVVSDGVTGHDVLAQVTITVRPVPSTVDPDEGIPWWILVAAALLFAGFAFVIWDHSRRRQRPPPPETADEWVETPDDEDWAPSMHMKSGQLE